jgi:hypothetical protein
MDSPVTVESSRKTPLKGFNSKNASSTALRCDFGAAVDFQCHKRQLDGSSYLGSIQSDGQWQQSLHLVCPEVN